MKASHQSPFELLGQKGFLLFKFYVVRIGKYTIIIQAGANILMMNKISYTTAEVYIGIFNLKTQYFIWQCLVGNHERIPFKTKLTSLEKRCQYIA